MKPTIEPNEDKKTTHAEINFELPNESISLITPTSQSAQLQEIDGLTNASTTVILPISPSAPSQEIDYLTMVVREVNVRVLGKGLELLSANGGRFEINQLLFADDTALVADSEDKLCRLVSEFGRVC